MDIRTLRNKKSKSRNARPYDRPNQSLLGKVASKVKGILYPSWLSTWMSSGEEPGGPNDPSEEESADEEDVQQLSARGSKRPRLRLHEHSPPILSEGTQTWLDTPSTSSIFNQAPRIPSTVTQSTLMQNKESTVTMNGDDHSENSEESASTSGCSSLVSHKDRSNCIAGSNLRLRESELESFRGQLKDVIGLNSRQSVTSQNESLSVNVGSSRLSLWSGSGNSSPASNLLCRSPTVVQRSQPGFNVSAFIGPSKLNQSTESKTSSPFYQGRTTFGGASSIRRMPVSAAPYQVDKPLRNQVKVRSNDSLEGMSSAAKRILMTLEKMSSPVTDAKKIPNTNKSPVDLSLYLMPPKHRSNVVSTPIAASKGPPIANISTISKLTTLRSCGMRRFQNSSMESLPVPIPVEEQSIVNDSTQQDVSPFASKGGGGKMRKKLTQQHQSSVRQREPELLEPSYLPNIPLPLSTLPTFNFESKTTQSTSNAKISGTDFTFSNPIMVLPKPTATLKPTDVTDRITQLHDSASSTDTSSNDEDQAFTFSRPIEFDSPFPVPSTTNISNSTMMWECSSCWVRNPSKETRCLACETPKASLGSASTLPLSSTTTISSNASSTWECSSCWVQNPVKQSKCLACEEPKPGVSSTPRTDTSFKSTSGFGSASSSTATWECNACWIRNPVGQVKCLACEAPAPLVSEPLAATSLSSTVKSGVTNSLSTWECSGCWVRNPAKESKCLACETPNPSHKGLSGESGNNAATSLASSSGSFFSAASSASSSFFPLANTATSGFKMTSSQNGAQTVSFGGFKIPVSTKPSDSDNVSEKLPQDKEEHLDAVTKTGPSASNTTSQPTVEKFLSAMKHVREAALMNEAASSSINGPNSVSSLSQKSSKVSEKEKTNGNFSFKSNTALSGPSPLSAFSTKPNTGFSISDGWECDICLVRNYAPLQTCPSCDSPRLTKRNASVLKDPDVFKFSSPLQGSPITFKFGTPTSTSVTDTSTSSKFTFSTPSSTTASNFFAPVSGTSSIQKSLAESKSLLATEAPATKLPVPEFKFDAPKLPSSDTAKPSIPIINLVDKTENSGEAKLLPDLNTASKSNAPSSVSLAFSASKSSDTNSTISCVTFSTPASTDSSKAFVSSHVEANNTLQVTDSKQLAENTTSGQSSLPTGGFNFKIPSTVALGGLSAPNNSLVSKTADAAASEKTTTLKQPLSEASDEKKTLMPFSLSSSTPSLVSPFGQSAPAPSMFSVGDSAAPKSSTKSSSLVKGCFAISTTSSNPTASSFSFSSNSTGAFSLVPSSAAQPSMPTASSLLQFQPGSNKNQDVKTVTPVSALSSTLTSSTFTFGDSTAAAAATTTQPSASTGFTFFSSSASATTTTTSSSGSNLFSFASSKPGGFTFKSSAEEKPNPVSSNSISFGAPSTTAPSSSVFKFGAATPASTGGFLFGAVKSEPVTTASSGFSFGSGTAATTNPSTFSGFQPTQPVTAPVFQFGAQPSGGTTSASQFGAQPSGASAPAPQFGASSNFTFGTKSETTNPLTQPASGAVAPASGFGSTNMQPMFGNTPALAFGKTDKPGFNFGAAATGAAPVFQFGNMEKKPAPQFSFGTPSQEAATPNSFVPTFNINTPANFNFGAASSTVQPFQFAASSGDSSLNSSSGGHRKIRKAVRRVQPKH